ncbi:MAG: S8 family serine peptidase [Myxococcota bacterium]
MRLGSCASLVLVVLSACPDAARADALPAARSVVVKLRAEGAQAVEACAETLWRRGAPLASATADGSASLDRLHRSLGVRAIRAVFRRPDGTPFESQRRALRQRLRAARPLRLRGSAPPDLAHVYRLELSGEVDARTAAARLGADPHVEYAQPNYWLVPDRLLDDPFLHSAGSWGQPYADLWGVHAIDAPGAWDFALGEGVVVAVVDTGVDYEHPDIAPNLWAHPGEDLDGDGVAEAGDFNGLDDDGNGFVDDVRGYDFHALDPDPLDENGHGTHVAGIVAARGDNGLGSAGVAPFATVMPVRVFPPFGPGESDRVWRGVLYAAENGADIINASFSCGRVCRSNPIAEEVLGFVAQLGVAFVTSAGNAASDVMLKSPERLRAAIVVGSTRPSGELAASSSFGLLVDVVAPGEDVLSLKAAAADAFYSPARFVGDAYMRLSGTSMATPHVSGALALLLSADPSLSPEALRLAIRLSARDLGDPGHDARFGSGLVLPQRALEGLPPPDVRGVILSPLPGDTVDTDALEIRIVGSITGADLETYRLEIGEGDVPEHWNPLPTPRAPPFEARELARLRLDELRDGPYVLRLTLVVAGDLSLHEFTPFSIDRSRPVFVSSPGADAHRADLHGVRVAWESAGTPDGGGQRERDLFLGRFGVEGETRLVEAPGTRTDVVLSGSGAVWRERLPDFTEPGVAVSGCLGRGRRAKCHPAAIAPGPGSRGRPDLSGRRVVFQDVIAGESQLRTCELGPDGCEPRRIAADVPSPAFPVIAGRRIVWSGRPAAGFGLFTCLLASTGEACPAVPVASSGLFAEPRALSGLLLAYQTVSFVDLTSALVVCRLDPATVECPPLQLVRAPVALDSGFAPDVSGNRVVWHGRGAHGELDIYTCEYDESGACPVQRVTSDAADQSQPRIDGHRVVWRDDREGTHRIASFELPALAPLRDRSASTGQLLVVPLRRLDSGPPVRFSVKAPDDPGAAELLEQRQPDRALFRWRPGPDQLGTHTFTFRATRAGGLYTEQTLRVHVDDPEAPTPRQGP